MRAVPAPESDTIAQLLPLIAEAADVDAGDIKVDGRLRGYGIDSVRVIELVLSIEETFGVKVQNDDLARLQTVRELARYIDEKKGG
jgi:acyl carrier protein